MGSPSPDHATGPAGRADVVSVRPGGCTGTEAATSVLDGAVSCRELSAGRQPDPTSSATITNARPSCAALPASGRLRRLPVTSTTERSPGTKTSIKRRNATAGNDRNDSWPPPSLWWAPKRPPAGHPRTSHDSVQPKPPERSRPSHLDPHVGTCPTVPGPPGERPGPEHDPTGTEECPQPPGPNPGATCPKVLSRTLPADAPEEHPQPGTGRAPGSNE